MAVMTQEPIIKLRVGALESTLSSKNNRIEEWESELASKNSEPNVASGSLGYAESPSGFVEYDVSLMR